MVFEAKLMNCQRYGQTFTGIFIKEYEDDSFFCAVSQFAHGALGLERIVVTRLDHQEPDFGHGDYIYCFLYEGNQNETFKNYMHTVYRPEEIIMHEEREPLNLPF
jgi:hypothetical protein